MSKNIKCSQCKYLGETIGVGNPEEGEEISSSFVCEADTSIQLNENNIKQLWECSFFRSRTETAWNEVKKDIINFLAKIFNFLIRKK
jgi:hypothetical protein